MNWILLNNVKNIFFEIRLFVKQFIKFVHMRCLTNKTNIIKWNNILFIITICNILCTTHKSNIYNNINKYLLYSEKIFF